MAPAFPAWPLVLLGLLSLPASQSLAPPAGPVVAEGVPLDGECRFGAGEVLMRPAHGGRARFEGEVTPGCQLVLRSASAPWAARSGGGCAPDPSVPCPDVGGLLGLARVLADATRDDATDPLVDGDGDPDPCPQAAADSLMQGGTPDPCRGGTGADHGEGTPASADILCQDGHVYAGVVATRKTEIVHYQQFEARCVDASTAGIPAPPQLRLGATWCEADGKYRLDPAYPKPCEVVQDQANLEGRGHGRFYKDRQNLADTRFHGLHSTMLLDYQGPAGCAFGYAGQLPVGAFDGACAFYP